MIHHGEVSDGKEQWLMLLDMSVEIRAFIAANEAQLKTKEWRRPNFQASVILMRLACADQPSERRARAL